MLRYWTTLSQMIWTTTDETSTGRPGLAPFRCYAKSRQRTNLFISHEVFGDSPRIVTDPKLLNLPYGAPRSLRFYTCKSLCD